MRSTYREGTAPCAPGARPVAVVQQTLVWPKVMVAMGAVIAVALTLFYALPYQEAVASAEQVVWEAK